MEGEKSDNQKPSFGKKKCVDYFKSAFKSLSPRRLFIIPSWIPRFKEPEHSFDTSFQPMLKLQELSEKLNRKEAPVCQTKFRSFCLKDLHTHNHTSLVLFKKFGKRGKFLKRGRKL